METYLFFSIIFLGRSSEGQNQHCEKHQLSRYTHTHDLCIEQVAALDDSLCVFLEFKEQFKLNIKRDHRGFKRVVQAKGIKFEIIHKGWDY